TFVTPRNSSGCPDSIIGAWAKTDGANVKTRRDNQAIFLQDLFIEFPFLKVGVVSASLAHWAYINRKVPAKPAPLKCEILGA
ncbi:MAG TPA: hypothetical protein VIC84_14070, partial [Blastocatellia bacterium]